MDRRAAKGAVPRQLALSGRIVDYSFSRRRRRTLGITVGADGLAVAAPPRMPSRDRGFPAPQGALDRQEAGRMGADAAPHSAARRERGIAAALRLGGEAREQRRA